ncbi:TPD1 protein homolog 1-like [Macadamia integrifolia]|uniref:TPD1 protein homolog 1-like n=1 Tax=Macadamia integrifolia TaxID=60698 RepID=UPI001C5335A1|nr:TPD1 protein homolog 1-like [Macadamia integrifolia]
MYYHRSLSFGFLLALFLLLGLSHVPSGTSEAIGGVAIKAEGARCSREDIDIYEGQGDPLPNGIPTYTVNIVNVCSTDCSISEIHVSCGDFSSARLINPAVFRRLSPNNCLVNDGRSLAHGQSISFVYANTYKYPLAVSSVSC